MTDGVKGFYLIQVIIEPDSDGWQLTNMFSMYLYLVDIC